MAKFPTYEEMSKEVAEKALDEFLYNGKSIREWTQIIASEDAISRRETIKKFTYNRKGERIPDYDCDNFPTQIDLKMVKEILMGLPPVTPQPKMGLWIAVGDHFWKCSECRCCEISKSNWCPNCGSKMQEVE